MTRQLVEKCEEIDLINIIVVVDNNSKEDSSHVQKLSNKVVYLKQFENNGYAKGNNIGFRYLYKQKCDYAFLANPDVEFTYDTIKNIIDFLENNAEYCVASAKRGDSTYGNQALQFWNRPNYMECVLEAFYLFRRINYTKRREKSMDLLLKSKGEFIEVEVVPGAFFGVKLCLLANIGYLDEDTFLWYEENCLSWKVHSSGYKEAILRNCYYYHNHRLNGHGNRLFHFYNRSKEYYCLTYLHLNKLQMVILKALDIFSNAEQRVLNYIGRLKRGNW